MLPICNASIVNFDLSLSGEGWHLRAGPPFRIFDQFGRAVFSDSWWRVSEQNEEIPLADLVGDFLLSVRIPPGRGSVDLELKTKGSYNIEVFDFCGWESWAFAARGSSWIW